MKSKKLPLSLSFIINQHQQLSSIIGGTMCELRFAFISRVSGLDEMNVLVKKGDDLRKDQLVMGVMKILGRLLEESGLKNHFQCYACLSTSKDEGLIEIVPNSITIGDVYNDANSIMASTMNEEISTTCCFHLSLEAHSFMNKINTAKRVLLYNFAIQEYLITNSAVRNQSLQLERERREQLLRLDTPRILKPKKRNESPRDSIEEISERFAASLGQYMMFVYLAGIGDRHNDNIMLNQNGYFHIDFGHILGHYKSKLGIKRERHNFLFTKAYFNVLGGESHPNFKCFMENALGCYRVIRRNYTLFYALFELLRDSGIDELDSDQDTQFFLDSCHLESRS